jgi:hypothetical protein
MLATQSGTLLVGGDVQHLFLTLLSAQVKQTSDISWLCLGTVLEGTLVR